MRKIFLSTVFCVIFSILDAQQIERIEVFSPSMKKEVENIVILPADYEKKAAFPVVYLLHGYNGSQTSWLTIKPDLPELATHHGIIIVCPDGENSWYWDSPVKSNSKFETYVSKELIEYVDGHYKTKAQKEGRAITGLSMGGHGALWLAFRHQDRFGACGSTSGGVDIRPFPNNWEMKELLGNYHENNRRWDSHTEINQLHLVRPGLAIIIDCGTEDFFFRVNERLHQEMAYRNIKHDYISRPGVHNGAYWRQSIDYQLQFFSNYFRGKLMSQRR